MKVGVQLYSVKNAMAENPLKCLKEVAEIGFKYIEPANSNADKDYGIGIGMPAKELKKYLDDLGLQVVNAHVSPLDEDNVKRVIEYHKILGSDCLTMPMMMYSSHDEALRMAEKLQKIGEICHANGMHYLYHNHYHEFQVLGGETVYETLVKNTTPEAVSFELDAFWAIRGGMDDVALINKLGNRLKMIHFKDFSKTCPQPLNMFEVVDPKANITQDYYMSKRDFTAFAEIGDGILNIQATIDAVTKNGNVDYMILEQDRTQMPSELDSLRRSMQGLKALHGLDL